MNRLYLLSLLLPLYSCAQETVSLEPLPMSGLDRPIGLTHAGDGTHRLFINEQKGVIRVFHQDVEVLDETPYLDIRDRIHSGGERGLLGVAFHPAYADNGYLYVHYSSNGSTCGAGKGDTVISRFSVSPDDPDRADRESEVCLLTATQPYGNHNGGQIAFGPDGYLYIGLGDGGSAGDPRNNAQNRATLLGAILRIDVDQGDTYAIPEDNPFADVEGMRGEIWAWGLRNPWRFSFDRQTGDLWIGDVGQNRWEEVDFQPASSAGGENYGWPCREGRHDYKPGKPGCPAPDAVEPVIEYGHEPECSVTGGYMHRGTRSPGLNGLYFYGDYCSGRIWAASRVASEWRSMVVHEGGFGLTTFGEDEDGEVYVVHGDEVYRITGSRPASAAARWPGR